MKRFMLLPILALLAVVGVIVIPGALAQDEATGANATKNCPGATAQLGETITCNFTAENTGQLPATITSLTELSPDPGGTSTDISCVGTDAVTYDEGDTLPAGVVCSGSFNQTIPNDPALCGTALRDRVEINLSYPQFTPPLTAGAFATHTTVVVCPANISITKQADVLGKVGDPVTYTFVIKNDGNSTVSRTSVNDTLLGDLTADFPPTLAAGASATVTKTRTVLAGDPDPLPNTVTAIYSAGASSDTATASASTNLFQPSIGITKNCAPNPVNVGQTVLCTIVISNTSSNDAPNLQATSIPDTKSGDLLVANPNVVSTNCGTGSLASGGSCTIVTGHTVTAADLPGPLTNSVTVNTNPVGFPNLVSATANASVNIAVNPNYTLTKQCGPSPANVGDPITYTFVITNTGDVALDRVSANDTLLGSLTADFPASLAPGGTATITKTRNIAANDPSPLPNTVTTVYQVAGTQTSLTRTANCSVTINPPPGGEGCTPGYWKQTQHFDSWVGYTPGQSFETVFGVDVTLRTGGKTSTTTPTLLQALEANGGDINALARHATAALLNASNPDVNFGMTPAQVIALVQDAVAPGGVTIEEAHQILAALNESVCPLN